MSGLAIVNSSLTTSLLRYLRSWGLWVLIVVTLVGSRFFVSRDDGTAIVIAVNDRLPVLTSAMLGVSLGIVVSTLMLPIGFIYLRANTTRRQPWQVEEVTAASRMAMALGRFCADVAAFAAVLTALTLAGFILAWLRLKPADIDPGQILLGLWLVAGPAVMGLAAVRILFDALPWLRGPLGDVMFFVLWMASIVLPVVGDRPVGFGQNLSDFPGFTSPLTYAAPLGRADGHPDVTIGGAAVKGGHIPLDVMAGLTAPSYVEARIAWTGIAVAVAGLAGLLYRPHRPKKQAKADGWLARLTSAGPPAPADPKAPAARASVMPWLGLLAAEFRLIGGGRLALLIALAAAASGLAGDYRHIGSAACLLVLIFQLSAEAGRSEPRGLLALTSTAMQGPMARRAAFVTAGVLWSLLLAVPALAMHPSPTTLELALGTGAAAALTSSLLGTLSRSAFAARLVLLVAWYAYLSS